MPAFAQRDCSSPHLACARAVPQSCLAALGAGTLAVEESCDAAMSSYRACLMEMVKACPATPASAPTRSEPGGRCDAQTAAALWAEVRDDHDCLAYQSFLRACPGSPQAELAKAQVERLGCARAESGAPGAGAGALELPALSAAQTRLLDNYDTLRRDVLENFGSTAFYFAIPNSQMDRVVMPRPTRIDYVDLSGVWDCQRYIQTSARDYRLGPRGQCRLSNDGEGFRFAGDGLEGAIYPLSEALALFWTGGDVAQEVGYLHQLLPGVVRIEIPRVQADGSVLFEILELKRW
ncbi:MAG: hypothetical protein MRY63_06090 [Neomegalonema sp.]|nr:hypothetical protein [Neomegalonema sp.]